MGDRYRNANRRKPHGRVQRMRTHHAQWTSLQIARHARQRLLLLPRARPTARAAGPHSRVQHRDAARQLAPREGRALSTASCRLSPRTASALAAPRFSSKACKWHPARSCRAPQGSLLRTGNQSDPYLNRATIPPGPQRTEETGGSSNLTVMTREVPMANRKLAHLPSSISRIFAALRSEGSPERSSTILTAVRMPKSRSRKTAAPFAIPRFVRATAWRPTTARPA